MPLGIRPINDMAFKKTFGAPENKLCLISLLNAILDLKCPVTDVTIENPYNLQDFESDKLSILDIKAIDQSGAIYDVEMQLTVFLGLVQRLVFYSGELFSGQLKAGDAYTRLCPVYTICLVDGILWPDSKALHHRFELVDRRLGRVLHDTLEIHTLELPLYTLTEADLETASTLEWWLFWLLHAHEYEPDELLKLFPQAAFQQATRTITQIAQKTEDKAMYDAREKAIRDYQSAISSAHREGRQEGRAEGRQEGQEIGEQRGKLMGKIGTLQEVLGLTPTDNETLIAMSTEELERLASQLQQSVRSRSSS